jgi:uncharacterized protein YoaH (UPF0181 family)
MDKKSRVRVRPILNVGVRDKKFKRRGLQTPIPLHELVVLMDLEKGVLASLDQYLAKHKGIPDRRIALALRKLISGSAQRSQFRLVVVKHPNLPPDPGGAPSRQRHSTTERHRLIVERFESLISQGDKKGIAIETVMSEFDVTERTVRRALREEQERRKSQTYDAEIQQDVAKGMSLREAIYVAATSRREK